MSTSVHHYYYDKSKESAYVKYCINSCNCSRADLTQSRKGRVLQSFLGDRLLQKLLLTNAQGRGVL